MNTEAKRQKANEISMQWFKDNRERAYENSRKWYINNKEKVLEMRRKWYRNNRERSRESGKNWRKSNRFHIALKSAIRKAKKFGYAQPTCSAEEIENKFTGYCEISGLPESEGTGKLVMDHCHVSGGLRGWIRGDLNLAIGHFKDDPDLLEAAAAYLRKHQHGSEDQNESTAA